MDDIYFIETKRKGVNGGKTVVWRNYEYRYGNKHLNISGICKTYWKCIFDGCTATLRLSNDVFEKSSKSHSHPAQPQKIKAKHTVQEMKRKITSEPLRAILEIQVIGAFCGTYF